MELKEIAEAFVKVVPRRARGGRNLDRLMRRMPCHVEAMDHGNGREISRQPSGRDQGKHAWWDGAMGGHASERQRPELTWDERLPLCSDVAARRKGQRNVMEMKEVAVYHVANAKSYAREFFG